MKALCHHAIGRQLDPVIKLPKLSQIDTVTFATPIEGLLQQEIRNLRVFAQKRPVQVGADHVLVKDTICLIVVVVAMTHIADHASKRRRLFIEVGSTGVVLEADDGIGRDNRGEGYVVYEAIGGAALYATGT